METTLNPAQKTAKQQIAKRLNFDSFADEYDSGAGTVVVEWYDDQYKQFSALITTDGLITAERQIWC